MKIELGDKVKDMVTGLEGIVISRTEWLNRCVRFQLQPQKLQDGKPADTVSFDEEQLVIVKRQAVVPAPRAAPTGGGDRPDPTRASEPRRGGERP